MSGRGALRGRRRIDARIIRQSLNPEEEAVEELLVARSLWTRGRFPSEASSFTKEDLDMIIRSIAESPSESLTQEEESYLPRPESPKPVEHPIQAEQVAPNQTQPSAPIPRTREWCIAQMKEQIASKAKTPGYWGKTAKRAGRCGFCFQKGHDYHHCPSRC